MTITIATAAVVIDGFTPSFILCGSWRRPVRWWRCDEATSRRGQPVSELFDETRQNDDWSGRDNATVDCYECPVDDVDGVAERAAVTSDDDRPTCVVFPAAAGLRPLIAKTAPRRRPSGHHLPGEDATETSAGPLWTRRTSFPPLWLQRSSVPSYLTITAFHALLPPVVSRGICLDGRAAPGDLACATGDVSRRATA